MIHLSFDKGTILIRGEVRPPNARWDGRVNAYRALAAHYRDIEAYLKESGLSYRDDVLDLVPCPNMAVKTVAREYQEKALVAWERAGRWGVVVLPTGAGKTLVALKAMAKESPAIVIVPTLDLLEQWKEKVKEELGVEAGVYCGGEHRLGCVTIATYDTAYIRAAELGNRFKLVVFDEVHHLASPGYSQIADMFACPMRMGLTATFEREDGLHKELVRLVGGKVFEMRPDSMKGTHLADYVLKRINVSLTPAEEAQYDTDMETYRTYLSEHHIILRTPRDFQRLVMRSGRDRAARDAILARHRARMTALNSQSKLDALADVLKEHTDDRVIIFTEHNDLVYRISREFLIPFITYTTSKEERSLNLDRFKSGQYSVIVTSKVLDEGVDVPDASVGVILSGTGSRREFVQRLGRILRKKGDKKAVLYEIVAGKTMEDGSSRRRKKEAGE